MGWPSAANEIVALYSAPDRRCAPPLPPKQDSAAESFMQINGAP